MSIRHSKLKSGFTLIETLLALALSVVVIGLIALSMDIHLRMTEQGRIDVERAQLVRALLRQITDDIRNTVRNSILDTQTAEELAGNLTGIDPDDLPDDLENLDGETGTLQGDADEAAEEVDQIATGTPSKTPGLYGEPNQLQIDISRLPRADELIASSKSGKPVSDVRTVAYYIGEIQSGKKSVISDDRQSQLGLIRRSLNRAATLYASGNGGATNLEESSEMFAPEVVDLQFRYWDGNQWLTQWSSDEQRGLPLAVEVTLVVDHSLSNPKTESNGSLLSNLISTDNNPEDHLQTYRSVVRISAARHAEVEESEAPEDESGEQSR